MPETFTLYLDSSSASHQELLDILDNCGVGFRIKDVAKEPAARKSIRTVGLEQKLPALVWNGDILSAFSRKELLDFLWAHGAKFEDS